MHIMGKPSLASARSTRAVPLSNQLSRVRFLCPALLLCHFACTGSLDVGQQTEAARQRLQEHPSELVTGEIEKMQSGGFFSSYALVEQVRFTNKSRFDISDVRGSISFRTSTGDAVATVAFKAAGFVYAGETNVLDVASSPVQIDPEKVSLIIENVHIWTEQPVHQRQASRAPTSAEADPPLTF
ncbi:MAG TPA: hypothetical protein VJU61_12435 [Polyangiaceae bacterium]|nr:hypothetical protein [Polyangiaceae bacterium]